MIESLHVADEVPLSVGLAEFENIRGLTTNELIEIAKCDRTDIFATQFLNANLVSGLDHLLSAAQNAVNAWKGNYMISRSLDVEILIYASTQRQIGKAIDFMGLSDGLGRIALVVIGNAEENVLDRIRGVGGEVGNLIEPPFEASIERIERIVKEFNISAQEYQTISSSDDLSSRMNAIIKCVVSRVTLVAFES